METSIYLAKVIGLISTITAISVIINYKRSLLFDSEAGKSPLFIYVSGFVFLILGALLVVSHSVWVSDWRLVITIIGWALLFKGILRILFPDFVSRLIEKKIKNRSFILGEVVVFLVGIYLLYYGFIAY